MIGTKPRRRGETRAKLMEAALELVGQGRHFVSMGIREVTRQAGVVPTSFYRHFRSMDDLGLQLVDELGLLLRQMMRDTRTQVAQADRMIEESVTVFIDCMCRTIGRFSRLWFSVWRAKAGRARRDAQRNAVFCP